MYSLHSLLVMVFILVSVRAEDGDLHFTSTPNTVEVVAGRKTSLRCAATPSTAVQYTWMLNGVPVENTTRRHVRPDGAAATTLHVLRADREADAGSFTCVVRNVITNATLISTEAQINVKWIGEARVQLQVPESASFIKPDSEVILRCHLDGTDDIHVRWLRNNDVVNETARVLIKKRRLHLKHVSALDNGVYKCIGENDAGRVASVSSFALAIPSEFTPLIQEVPTDEVVKLGDTAFFHCVYDRAEVTLWYYKSIAALENTTTISVFPNGTLIIRDVAQSDEGVYRCEGTKADSTAVPQTYSAELKIAYLENFTMESFEPQISESFAGVAEGGRFQLTCLPPDGDPAPNIWWKSPHNHTISDAGDVRVDGGRLIVTDAKVNENTGLYTCVAENKAGIVEKSLQLVVTKTPIISDHPKNIALNEGEPAEFQCDFAGTESLFPVTTIRWRKNGKIVNDEKLPNGGFRVRSFLSNGTLLLNPTKGSDQGHYKCEVLSLGQPAVFSNPASLNVIEKLKFSPPPVNKKLELGSVGKIHCKAQGGAGSPIVRWIKIKHARKNKEGKKMQQDDLSGSPGLPAHVDDVNGTLLFNSVRNEDAGTYTCIAKDGEDIINTTITVTVVVAPKFIEIPKNPTEAIEGGSTMIHCVVDGDPKPTIQWDKNRIMNDFDSNRFEVLENGSLYIKEVHMEDEKSYGCTAGNSAGLNRKEAKLLVRPGDGYRADGTNESDGAMITKAVLITTSVAAAYMLLVIGLMLWCRYRRRSRKLALDTEEAKDEIGEEKDPVDANEGAIDTNVGPSDGPALKKKGTQPNGEAHKSDSADTAYSQSSGHSKKSKSSYDKFQISRDGLKDVVHIGRGEFGDVMVGKLTAGKRASVSEDSTEPQSVMIKSLVESKDEQTLAEFKRQLDLFSKKPHDNVARLIGLSREAEPHYMILEYTDWGDLKRFLVATKKESSEKSNPSPPPLSVSQIVSIALQLARGVEHIADQRMIHKDIATRNCLITSQLVAKISLAALTKDIYREEYCKHVNQIIPLRWMPPEAVYEDEYSTKSDVWAWACLVWELFNQGELPFSDLSDSAVLAHLKEHTLKWSPHKATPPALVELQESCWLESAADRPTFTTIVQQMTDIVATL